MKKIFAAIVAGVMVFACLTGCGAKKEEPAPEQNEETVVEE